MKEIVAWQRGALQLRDLAFPTALVGQGRAPLLLLAPARHEINRLVEVRGTHGGCPAREQDEPHRAPGPAPYTPSSYCPACPPRRAAQLTWASASIGPPSVPRPDAVLLLPTLGVGGRTLPSQHCKWPQHSTTSARSEEHTSE